MKRTKMTVRGNATLQIMKGMVDLSYKKEPLIRLIKSVMKDALDETMDLEECLYILGRSRKYLQAMEEKSAQST